MRSAKVVLGWIHNGYVTESFMDSMLRLLSKDMQTYRYIHSWSRRAGCSIPKNRNTVVRDFLRMPGEPGWLLMIDTDCSFGPDLIHILMHHASQEHRVIACNVAMLDGETVFFTKEAEGVYFPAERTQDLQQVDAVGTGGILINRTVLDEMYKAFPAPFQWFNLDQEGGSVLGSDLTFSRRVASLGIPLYGCWEAELEHWKLQPVRRKNV